MEKLILSLGLCLTLAALGLNRPVLALPTRLGADELPPRYYVYEAKVSGDGKRVAIMDLNEGSLDVYPRGALEGDESTALKSWKAAFPEFQNVVSWQLDDEGARVAALGTAAGTSGQLAMALYDLSTSPPKALWIKKVAGPRPAESAHFWAPHFVPGEQSVVFGATVYEYLEQRRHSRKLLVDETSDDTVYASYKVRSLDDGSQLGKASISLGSDPRPECPAAAVSQDGSTAAVWDGVGKAWLITGLGTATQKTRAVDLAVDVACPHLALSKTGSNLLVLWRPELTTFKETTRALVYRTATMELRANISSPCGTEWYDGQKQDRVSAMATVYFSGQDEPTYLTCINPTSIREPELEAPFTTTFDLGASPPKKLASFPARQEWVNACVSSDLSNGRCYDQEMSRAGGQVVGFMMGVNTGSEYKEVISWWDVA